MLLQAILRIFSTLKMRKYMLSGEAFRAEAHKMVDWIADYYNRIEDFPVKATCQPGSVIASLPGDPPVEAEGMPEIFKDFEQFILPGITHWQSPSFFAYFPANASFPSLLAEMLTSALGAQCMKWETSPAATELEQVVMRWLRSMIGLPESFTGVIQDTASTATLCAILSAREKSTQFESNHTGLSGLIPLRVYCSTEAHASVEKAVKIAGMGSENLIKIDTDKAYRMLVSDLENKIKQDHEGGLIPICVVAAMGTTSSAAVDPIGEIAMVCKKYGIWLHVDGAYAGSALILPEYQQITHEIQLADSFVFNPHKWLFTHFDCSAYFVKDPQCLINTFRLVPEYLKNQTRDKVNDYSNWGIQLGRRFRALKLWFVIRSFGVSGLQSMIRRHISMANELKTWIEASDDFDLLAPVNFALVCFRFHPRKIHDAALLDDMNEQLLIKLNQTGKMYISHTRLANCYTLRVSVGQTQVQPVHIQQAWRLIKETAVSIYAIYEKDQDE
jgi:aromatic-L-amino-acid decarboxylase